LIHHMRFALISCVICLCITVAQTQQPARPAQQDVVVREPFTLKLPVDKTHYYEERYERKVPYVFENDVYLFNGEKFGIKVTTSGNEIAAIRYEKDVSKADVTFEFKQDKDIEGSLMTLLLIENKLPRRLYLDALMTRPDKKEIFRTSILPVDAKLFNAESWPHPIVQLVLRNFRFSEKSR
jgi:hypothetical protein